MQRYNANGLAYDRWLAAAGVQPGYATLKHRRAWLDCEDPAEWLVNNPKRPAVRRKDGNQ